MNKANQILQKMNFKNLNVRKSKQIKKVGQAPGTLIYTGDIEDSPIEISVIRYSEDSFERAIVEKATDVYQEKNEDTITWINIEGIHDTEVIQQIGKEITPTDA